MYTTWVVAVATSFFGLASACGPHPAYHRRTNFKRQNSPPAPPPPAQSSGGSAPFTFTPNQPTQTVASHAPGATPPIPGAPGLPQPFVFKPGVYPKADTVPDTNSQEVAQWMKELDGHNIPNIPPTKDGTCDGDAAAAANAKQNGWWTCTGDTRDTDIVSCPDKQTWGVSFDDGPGAYTPTLLNYLQQQKISATFFVIGSRILELPIVLVDEYMQGHEISCHTWSHSKPLTSLTNEQIVAELGWTRKLIKDVLGVSPTTMRPPWGDIDDRVRAITMAMGMIPVIWTKGPSGVTFDTNDWKVPGGEVTVDQSLATFQSILDTASQLNTGFIVLQHDMHEETVAMAIQKTLSSAMTHNPPFKLEKIGQCMKFPVTDLYQETTKNTTFPFRVNAGSTNKTAAANGASPSNGAKPGSSNSTSGGSSNKPNSAIISRTPTAVLGLLVMSMLGMAFS